MGTSAHFLHLKRPRFCTCVKFSRKTWNATPTKILGGLSLFRHKLSAFKMPTWSPRKRTRTLVGASLQSLSQSTSSPCTSGRSGTQLPLKLPFYVMTRLLRRWLPALKQRRTSTVPIFARRRRPAKDLKTPAQMARTLSSPSMPLPDALNPPAPRLLQLPRRPQRRQLPLLRQVRLPQRPR